MLHITNGDCAAEALVGAGIAPGDILPWRDVLHEGPVPGGLPIAELSSVRARFLSDDGFGDYDDIRGQFYERDVRIAGSQAEDEVVCWFESDLYDQLQLLQVLDWYAEPSHRPLRLSLIQLDLGRDDTFEAAGALEPARVDELLGARCVLAPEQLEVAQRAWSAYRAPTPRELEGLWRAGALESLPCLPDAVHRVLEELPWLDTGLSRSERSALECLATQPLSASALFAALRARESRPFLGDAWLWRALEALEAGARPLLSRQLSVPGAGIERSVLALTPAGQALLAGQARPIEPVERWWGGTRIRPPDTIWRWDGARERTVEVREADLRGHD